MNYINIKNCTSKTVKVTEIAARLYKYFTELFAVQFRKFYAKPSSHFMFMAYEYKNEDNYVHNKEDINSCLRVYIIYIVETGLKYTLYMLTCLQA